MFGWFKKMPEPEPDPRAIFRFSDGKQTVFADPLVAWARFEQACGCDPEALLREVASKPPDGTVGAMLDGLRKKQAESAAKLADGVCEALGVMPLQHDGSGLSQAERIALAVEFIDYLGGLAAAAAPFAESPSATG